jgi:hypothetical protein
MFRNVKQGACERLAGVARVLRSDPLSGPLATRDELSGDLDQILGLIWSRKFLGTYLC